MEKVYVPDFGLYGKIKRKRKGEIVVVFPQVGLWGKFKEEQLFASKGDFLLASQREKILKKRRERPEQLQEKR